MITGGSGAIEMVGGTGAGAEEMRTGSGQAFIGLNNNADMVVGGSGDSIVIGGTGPDLFAFLYGHAGGSETIINFKIGIDALLFDPGYGGHAVASESVENVAGWGKSDVLTLSDNTTITLVGVHSTLYT
jgi:hypothetical protein